MSLWSRLFAKRQTADTGKPGASRVPFAGKTLAGVYVTADTAVQVAAVWACLRYLSQTVALLPWNVMASEGRGATVQGKNPVHYLLHTRPSAEWSSFQFRETLTHWALRWGNGYAEIERDMAGRPYALWPIHPDRVDPLRDDSGALFFRVDNGRGGKVDIAAADMFHVRGFGEGVIGVNVMEYAAQSIGWAKALQLFGASFFGNGANVAGIVQTKYKLEKGPLDRMRAEFNRLYQGPRNANKVAFLDNGSEWKDVGIVPERAQMIDANNFMVEEICRWFGVPPHKVQHLLRSTFSNIEHQAIEVVQDSLLPWVRRFEDEADAKLFGQNRQGLFTKLELRGLLRGDFKTQQEGFAQMRLNGIINADEWRELTDMEPMAKGAGGDKYLVQAQLVELATAGEAMNADAGNGGGGGDAASGDSSANDDGVEEVAAIAELEIMAESLHVAAV